MDVEIKMLQDRLMVASLSIFYTVSNVLFHKDWGENVGATNCMSHFFIFVPTMANVKTDNVNTEHA